MWSLSKTYVFVCINDCDMILIETETNAKLIN